jgi:hypothetical protein
LLIGQCGITDVLLWKGEHVQYNLDKFRSSLKDDQLLSEAHLDAFGVSADLSNSWLHRSLLNPKHVADIVINWSGRYAGPLRWQELDGWVDKAVFVGFDEEWLAFKKMTGFDNLRLYKPESYVDICNVLLGSKLFIGNQSFVYSLAEALKVNRVQEACLICPNCLPQSGNGHVVLNQSILNFYAGSYSPCSWLGFGGYNQARSMMHVRNRFFGTAIPRPSRFSGPVFGRPLVSIISIGQNREFEKRFESVKSKEVFGVESIGEVEDCLRKTSGDFICLIEDDVEVTGAWFQDLASLMIHAKVGAVGQRAEVLPLMHIAGGVVLLNRRAWQECGLFCGDDANPWVSMAKRFRACGYVIRQSNSKNVSFRVCQ